MWAVMIITLTIEHIQRVAAQPGLCGTRAVEFLEGHLGIKRIQLEHSALLT
jgi:hypothetical protein